MPTLVRPYATDDSFRLHTLEVLGESTAVDADRFRHPDGSDLRIVMNERNNGLAGFLSTFSVHLSGWPRPAWILHAGVCHVAGE